MGSGIILPQPGQPITGPDPDFKRASIPNLVDFGFHNIDPPSSLYIQRNDVLNVEVITNQPAETVRICSRLLLPVMPLPGQPDAGGPVFPTDPTQGGTNIVEGQSIITPTALRTAQFTNIPLMECYLLSVNAFSTVATTRGQTFVQVQLIRAGGGSGAAQTLFADYVTLNKNLSYPGGRALNPIEAPGWSHSVQVANPAAGADWTLTVLAGQRFAPKSFNAFFTESAAVANRQVNVIIDDGVNAVWQDDVTANIVAGQAGAVSGAQVNAAVGVFPVELFVVMPPGIFLEPGWRLRTSTTGIQAGDQWSAIWFAMEEWFDLV